MVVRTRSWTLLVVATCAATAAAQTPATTTPLTLADAFARATAANPTIAAARQQQAVAVAAIGVARQRPNPDLHVEYTRETPTQAFTLALPIETGGKRQRRIALGDAGVQVSGAEAARTALDLRVEVRRAYFELADARARLALLQDMFGLATRARDAAQQRFAAGDVPRLEVLQAELARAEAENQATAAAGAADAAAARLRALLALPAEAGIVLATPIDDGIGRRLASADAAPANAGIAVLDARLEEQRARIALAAAMRRPDVTPEAALTRGAEPEFATGWRAGLGLTLPIFTRGRAAVRLEEATLLAVTAEREAAVARVRGEVSAATAVAASLGQQYLRYQTSIVPQAAEIEQLADDAYRLGRTGIAAYLQALQAAREVRLRMLQTAADFQSALADLERALGAPLP
jgi:cobalt-zinc-cadmium efflux system outer membrane protein